MFDGGVCIFDGQIGCFSLVIDERAKRSSVNGQTGTWEVKPIAHIKRDVVREFMIERVLLAIRAKMVRRGYSQTNLHCSRQCMSRLQLLSREDLVLDLFVNLQDLWILIYYIWVSFMQSKPFNIRNQQKQSKNLLQ
jgi:hypothetical protein